MDKQNINPNTNKQYETILLKQMFNLHAEEAISEEQVTRVLFSITMDTRFER